VKKRYLKIAFQVIAWALFISAPFFFEPPGEAHKDKMPLLIIIPWIFLIAFYYSNYYLFIPKVLFKKKVGLYIFILLLCLFCFLFLPEVLIYFNHTVLPKSIPNDAPALAHLGSIVFFLLTFIISSSISVINELFFSWSKKQQLEVEKSKAELAFFQSQINPHFLFNTLYSIYYLAINKSDKAPEAVMKLSDIMRFVLTESQCDYIPLQNEIDYISKYIDLQKLRISEKTKINFEIEGSSNEKRIAPLLLIPFVENAFKYGVSSHTETTIEIMLKVSGTALEFAVSNNKFSTVSESEKNKIGLENVKQRLLLQYALKHKLTISNEENRFSVNLMIMQL
jgi:two-component system, LytTR family, sensor kinase